MQQFINDLVKKIVNSYDMYDCTTDIFMCLGLLAQYFRCPRVPNLKDYNVDMYIDIVEQQ